MFSGFALLLHLFLIALILNPNYVKPITTNEISAALIDTWLQEPLKYVNHIKLCIRQNDFRKDIANQYIQWFLWQNRTSNTITTYSEGRTNDNPKKQTETRNNHVIVTNTQNIGYSLKLFGAMADVLYIVIEGDLDVTLLLPYFKEMFHKYKTFPNYLLSDNGILVYNPFIVNANGEYGELVSYMGDVDPYLNLFSNMYGFPLKVLIFPSVYAIPIYDNITRKIKSYSGVDGDVAELLKEKLNFTLELKNTDAASYGGQLPNGSFNGGLGTILNGEADICLTGYFIKDYLTRDIEFSVAMYDDRLCVYMQKRSPVPAYLVPIFAIPVNVWISFGAVAVISSFMWILLRIWITWFNISKKGTNVCMSEILRWQFVTIFKDTWLALIRVSLRHYPKYVSEKIFFASLCLASVMFGAMLECSLASIHIKPLYFDDINSLDELDKSGMRIVYRHIAMGNDLFDPDTSPLFARLHSKLVYISDPKYHIVKNMLTHGNEASVNRYNSLMLTMLHFIVTNRIWIIPECPKSYNISYFWLHDSPWEEIINYLLLQFLQFGLVKKFEREVNIYMYVRKMKDRLYESSGPFKVLRIEDFELAFIVLLLGNLLGIILLIIENIVNYIQQKKKTFYKANLISFY
ncbi:uncharacterized protein LOC142223105 [Haematobia irritans]|uniref:uncharacterized protein LOC142223105 n=1 Tax=Haematobia irritans TaxID=7368 RepID=UPI003F4FBBFE